MAHLDSILRLCVPAAWRRHAGDLLYVYFSRNSGHPVIKVVTRSFYDERMELILRQDAHEKSVLVSRLENLTRQVKLDTSNRISISSDMGDLLGIVKRGEVTLVGCGDHFEIWRADEFKAFLEQECSREILEGTANLANQANLEDDGC